MKSYTDIEQSKKLAEILPLESADMIWVLANPDLPMIKAIAYEDSEKSKVYEILPAWSLTALLGVLPDSIYDNTDEFSQLEFTKKSVAYIEGTTDGVKIGALKDNLVDACVAMIEKLHELKML